MGLPDGVGTQRLEALVGQPPLDVFADAARQPALALKPVGGGDQPVVDDEPGPFRSGRDSEKEEIWVAKIAAVSIGAIAIAIAVIGGEGLNVSFMVGLAFAVAASAIFPALLLALTWRRFNTTGAVTGVLVGVISSIALVIISPTVWPGPDSEGGALGFYDLANPGIVSIPLGFIACWLGTVLTRETVAERSFDELFVRSETGLGAELGTGLTLTGRRAGSTAAAAATTTTLLPHP